MPRRSRRAAQLQRLSAEPGQIDREVHLATRHATGFFNRQRQMRFSDRAWRDDWAPDELVEAIKAARQAALEPYGLEKSWRDESF